MSEKSRRKVLLLHGSRQTGELLLGRMDKIRKRLSKQQNLELVPCTAPFSHPDDAEMRQWWNRQGDAYQGLLEETIPLLQQTWMSGDFVGIMGFSQGARLAHLCCLAHAANPSDFLPGLKFAILVAGYEAPLPPDFEDVYLSHLSNGSATALQGVCSIPTMHVMGHTDKLITPDQSRGLLQYYVKPQVYEHEGGHHVPMRAANVRDYEQMIESAMTNTSVTTTATTTATVTIAPNLKAKPDEETAQLQQDEVEALTAIYPDEFHLVSKATETNDGEILAYEHPICYRMDLIPSDDNDDETAIWPPHPMAIQVTYPHNYPQEALPRFKLIHDNNMMEFSTGQADALLHAMQEAGQLEEGMPCVMSCFTAARDFFEMGMMATVPTTSSKPNDGPPLTDTEEVLDQDPTTAAVNESEAPSGLLPSSTREQIDECNLQGLEIARNVLDQMGMLLAQGAATNASSGENAVSHGKGGHWTYNIGLVGKPSAGKSTFFNAATAFARQRDDSDNILGGATMAPHPFTTIDPNVGFCLVPAPHGSCPEDDDSIGDAVPKGGIGSTHGRDHKGRRLLPVLLKDVAGLVPGAYQGRGRGNKFLNDLTDAHVLIHVLDASGTADVEGNDIGTDAETGMANPKASNPLNDMAWIRTELVEWVFSNLMYKWDSIKRRGRNKLADMFGGYGQNQAVTANVLTAVEKFMESHQDRERAFDHLDTWTEADVHRLVSSFLGVRFPMALALNKCDLPTSVENVANIQEALPTHGAHVGTPLSARSEMNFIRYHIEESLGTSVPGKAKRKDETSERKVPEGVWACLQSALTLREPVLVFPVADLTTFASLPGLFKYATSDPSLPSGGMIRCLEAAGGEAPSLWNQHGSSYFTTPPESKSEEEFALLRDALIMKPGSTVEDVFLTLKRLGGLGGEFIRAEATGTIGTPSRPVPKSQKISRSNCIIKIMTSKRSTWQKK
eukprot:CAMPEP_0172446808 /NCGR_PEP_ID=MMETSP1065-20121228/6307_1 /TAXON_ID=265537 /ORGANISM="Amphiprora paludosa, Strain CCMP125" /LENGTH=956 /DNA_ID=CAMNT_0013197997 /DNA_START=84 /DNA_END=2954 /DNA_ORIENTATION=-